MKFENNETFEAEMKDVVKGGLVVDLGVRGFVPASLVESHFVEDFSDYKGKTLTFKITELDKEKNRLILSHRAVLEEEKIKTKTTIAFVLYKRVKLLREPYKESLILVHLLISVE